MKTQRHDLLLATRTSVQDPTLRLPGIPETSSVEFEKKVFGSKMKMVMKVSCEPVIGRQSGPSKIATRPQPVKVSRRNLRSGRRQKKQTAHESYPAHHDGKGKAERAKDAEPSADRSD